MYKNKTVFNRIEFEQTTRKNYLSVIIPVYRDVDGLERTIYSIYKQNFNKRRYEILVGNDGANRKIEALCRKFNISCLSIRPRKGSYNARNEVMKNSMGECIAFIDAGTIADRQWMRKGVVALKRNDYVGGHIEIIRPQEGKISDSLFFYQKGTSFNVAKYMAKLHFAPTTNLFVKREVVERLGGFDKRLQSGGDWEFGDRVKNSTLFSQKYVHDLRVYHYARNYKSLVKKIGRVSGAQANLVKLYPRRFRAGGGNILVAVMRAILTPPRLLNRKPISSLPVLKKVELIFIAYSLEFESLFRYASKLKCTTAKR